MKRSPLRRKTPLKPKRDTPRRTVRRSTPGKSAAEKRHHDRVAAMPCIACKAWPVHVHHVISDGFQRITRDHRLVLPVCPLCHQDGPNAIHRIGTRKWNEMHGIDQLAEAKRLWDS